MPKIRQAIALLAAAAFCIAFNSYRYPVVREMAAAISSSAPSEGAASTEKAAEAEKTHDGNGAAETVTSKPPAGVVCKDGVCTMPLPDSPTASLSSTFPGDAASSGSEQADEHSARPSDSADGAESTSKLPEDGQSPSNPPDETESSPNDESAKPESSDPPAESTGQDASPSPDPHSTPAHDTTEEPSGAKQAAKLVSTSEGGSLSQAATKRPPTAKASLIPIVRPTPRNKRSDVPASKAASNFKLSGDRGRQPQGVRQLPPVDSPSGADTRGLTPDLVRTYPVTSAK